MDYKQSWEDMRFWLEKNIPYLEQRCTELSTVGDNPYFHKELARLQGKVDGLKTVRQQMDVSEKIYGGNE